MKRETLFDDKRLLRALDHIDDDLVEKAAKRIKERPLGMTVGGSMNKMKIFKQIAALAACVLLLSAAIPLASSIITKYQNTTNPAISGDQSSENATNDVTDPENPTELPDEYFTAGKLLYWGSTTTGIEYEGLWIKYQETNGVGRIIKYDPATNSVSSVCLDSSCKHSSDMCALCIPSGGSLNFMDVFDDWLIYDFSTSSSDGNGAEGNKICLYNMKTGEAQVIHEKIKDEDRTEYVSSYQVMDGIVYMSIRNIDTSDPGEKKVRKYIASYDPLTRETVSMFDEPEGMIFMGISNKRFFYVEGKPGLLNQAQIWTTDYKGENLKKETVLDFDPVMLCGTYAYAVEIINYEKNGYNMRVYDLATDSTFTIDIGKSTANVLADSGKLVFVTADGAEIYITDARGENKELINVDLSVNAKVEFTPYRIVGDYLMCNISLTEANNIQSDGICALNLKTGEITPVPQLAILD